MLVCVRFPGELARVSLSQGSSVSKLLLIFQLYTAGAVNKPMFLQDHGATENTEQFASSYNTTQQNINVLDNTKGSKQRKKKKKV